MTRVAYLIDKESLGGGCEYIRRCGERDSREGREWRSFYSVKGECTSAKLDAWGADEIVVNHLRALLQLLWNPFRRPRGRIAFVVHGIHLRKYDFLPNTPLNRLKRWLRLSLERLLYHRCDRLTALTDTDAAEIRRLYGRDLPIVVEPNTVCPSDFAASPAGLRYRPDEFAFVCIARFDFQKGQDILIRAIAAAQDGLRKSGSRTLLIGGGQTLDEMKRLATTEGVSDLVEFVGAIPSAGAYMTCGRVLVAPSRWEGMPYLLLEAVARRRRIVASDCPGNRDVLKGYAEARLFRVEDVGGLALLMTEADL